jgi:CubicO group peptidase (beta-lactamase class C family)
VTHYGFQWWLAPDRVQPWHYSARGMRGQYIVVIPDEDLIVVRMGRMRVESRTNNEMSPDLERWVDLGLQLKARYAERY